MATSQIEGVLSPNRSRASLPKLLVGVGVGVCAGGDEEVVPPGAFPAPVDGAGRCGRCDAGADGADGAAGTETPPAGGAGAPTGAQAAGGHGAVGG
jgi:hypothetical protein